MNILVFGAGAVGSFVGGHLAASGHGVTLLGRPPSMQKIAGDGLTIFWPDRPPVTSSPKTATSLDKLSARYDLILLTVKSPATPTALAQLAGHRSLLDNAYIVSLQNGLGNEEQIAAAFGPAKCIAGTITIPIEMLEPGRLEVSRAKGGLGLAPLDPSQPVKLLASALNQAGLRTLIYADYQAMKWSKLLLNIVNNATSAILDQPPAHIIAHDGLFNLEIGALQEGVKVMKARGIQAVELPGYRVNWLARLVTAWWLPLAAKRAILRPFMQSGRGTKMPSLHLDLASGRSTSEIRALNGAIVQAGQQIGIATPINQTLTTLLTDLVSGKAKRTEYRNQPQKLISAVQHRKSIR